jgi:hypothetical protein
MMAMLRFSFAHSNAQAAPTIPAPMTAISKTLSLIHNSQNKINCHKKHKKTQKEKIQTTSFVIFVPFCGYSSSD